MADGPKKISALPATANIVNNDIFAVVTNTTSTAVTSSAKANTVFNYIASRVLGSGFIPGPFTNDSTASAGSVVVGGLYYDTTGVVRIRLS